MEAAYRLLSSMSSAGAKISISQNGGIDVFDEFGQKANGNVCVQLI